ncbi:MAG: hemolysin III family protein, partial [Bacteroidales bacterium]|nr:hemolysin III family protein [Bacteroidales bacterium]
MKRLNAYSLGEEIVNCITHGLGLVMSLAVCILFLVKGTLSDSWITTFSFILYLIGVCSSYAASTIYHAIPGERVKAK